MGLVRLLFSVLAGEEAVGTGRFLTVRRVGLRDPGGDLLSFSSLGGRRALERDRNHARGCTLNGRVVILHRFDGDGVLAVRPRPEVHWNIPSGLNGDSGEAYDPTIRAVATLPLRYPKRAFYRRRRPNEWATSTWPTSRYRRR